MKKTDDAQKRLPVPRERDGAKKRAPQKNRSAVRSPGSAAGAGVPAAKTKQQSLSNAAEKSPAGADVSSVPASARSFSGLRKTMIAIEGRPTENPYYLGISKSFRVARFVTILLLILFVLSMLTVYSSDITVENFKYLMKYMDINLITSPDEFKDLNYESGSKMEFGFYQGNFVSVRENGISLYDQFASTVLEVSHSMVSPLLVTSDKYILVLDQGGHSYSLLNSFSPLYSTTTEYPISTGTVCDEGTSVIVSTNLSYLSAVYIYDSNFNLVGQMQKDKYVMSVDLTDDGEKLAVLSMYGNNEGRFCGELQIYNIKKGEIEAAVEYYDILPLQAKFNDDGVTVLFNNELRFYNTALEPSGSVVSFSGKSATVFDIGEKFCAVAVSENGIGYQSRVLLYDNTGTLLASYRTDGQLTKLRISEDAFFLLTTDRLYRGDTKGEISYIDVEKDGLEILLSDNREMLFLCYSNRAYALDPLKSFSEESSEKETD